MSQSIEIVANEPTAVAHTPWCDRDEHRACIAGGHDPRECVSSTYQFGSGTAGAYAVGSGSAVEVILTGLPECLPSTGLDGVIAALTTLRDAINRTAAL